MGIMAKSCVIRSVKFDLDEVILIDDDDDDDDVSQSAFQQEQIQVTLKQECESSFDVKTEFQDLIEPKPFVPILKQEEVQIKDENNHQIVDINLNYNNAIISNIKTEAIKSEEIYDITDDYEDYEEEEQEASYTCTVCGYKSSNKETLTSHKLTHVGVKQYKCSECDYSTSLRDIFKTHMLNHKRYECDYCEFTTFQNDNFNEHILMHIKKKSKSRGEKPFIKCNKCKFVTDKTNSLKRHFLLTHSNKKLLECYTCGHKTPSKNNLRKHVRIHFPNRIKNYKCNSCKSRFLYEASLLRHMSVRPCKLGHS